MECIEGIIFPGLRVRHVACHTRARSFHIGRCCAILNNVGPKQPTLQLVIGGQLATSVNEIG